MQGSIGEKGRETPEIFHHCFINKHQLSTISHEIPVQPVCGDMAVIFGVFFRPQEKTFSPTQLKKRVR